MKGSKGSASILEYTLVLPVCLISVVVLFFTGYYLCYSAVLDAAADRVVLLVHNIYENTGKFDADFASDIAIKEAEAIIDRVNFLGDGILLDRPVIDVRTEKTIMGWRVSVEILQEVQIPVKLRLFLYENSLSFRMHSGSTVCCPADLVRYTDFVLQLIERFTGIDIDISSELEDC